MSTRLIQPHPSLSIRSEDRHLLPLSNFQLLIVVEPNPETWTLAPGEESTYSYRTQLLSEMIMDEITDDGSDPHQEAFSKLVVVWLKGSLFPYSNQVIEELSDLTITTLFDYGHLEHLGYYITGISIANPDWHAAVIGAAEQQEVIRVGNVVQENGLWTTVLARYCYPLAALKPYLRQE